MSSQSSNNRVGQQGRFQEVICTQVPTRSWQLACDGFGNLAARTGTGTAQSTTISTPTNATTNQLSGYSYDANGNQISTGYSYDVENRMSFANGGGVQYFYDAQNKRVWQASCTTSGYCTPGPGWVLNLNQDTVNLFGADGKQLASYQAGGAWNPSGGINVAMGFSYTNTRVYFGGRLVGQQVGTNGYLAVIQDRLGSVGKYYPYGEERNSPQLPNDQVKFATYTRDSATGNDYADQRYYSSVLGRFMTPDRYWGSASLTNPQSWNRFEYVLSDPVNHWDPNGLCDVTVAGIRQDSATAQDVYDYGYQDITIFPYASGAFTSFAGKLFGAALGAAQVAVQTFGPTSQTLGVIVGLLEAAQQGGPINVTAFSGGAAAFTDAVNWLNANGESSVTAMIGNITYVSPGAVGTLYVNANTSVLLGTGPLDTIVTALGAAPGATVMQTPSAANCGHDFGCIVKYFADYVSSRQGPSCPNPEALNVTQRQGAVLYNAFSSIDWAYYSSLIDFQAPSNVPLGTATSTITYDLP